MNPDDHAHLMQAAKARALELRRQAIDDFWAAVFAYAASLMASSVRAPRSRSTRAPASDGSASPRQATC